jgi:hypothetical protein
VTWATTSREATVRDGKLTVSDHGRRLGALVVTSDAEGRFQIPPEADAGLIVAAHEQGFAEAAPADLAKGNPPVLTLRPWGRVEGRVLVGEAPASGRLVVLSCYHPPASSDAYVSYSDETKTDASGRFAFGRVVAGWSHLNRAFETTDGWLTLAIGSMIEVRSNETTRATLGGPGRAVIGKIAVPEGSKVDLSKVRLRLAPPAPHIGFSGDDEMWKAYGRFGQSDEGKAYFRSDLPVNADGTFRLEGVPQGDFLLQGIAADMKDWLVGTQFTVPATPDGRSKEPVSLGTLKAQP